MATDQGKTSNINGHAIMAALTQRADPRGRDDDRAPALYAVALGALADLIGASNFDRPG